MRIEVEFGLQLKSKVESGGRIVRLRNLFSVMGFVVALLGAAGLFPAAASADYAVLRSGARLHITGYERDGERVRLTVDGGTVICGGCGFGGCRAGGTFRGGTCGVADCAWDRLGI